MALPAKTQTGQMIDGLWMNANVRDQLNGLGANAHTGSEMDGATVLSSLDRIDFDHQGALGDPAAGHTRAAMNADGTFRWRASGDTEKTGSVVGHTH